YRVKIDTVGYAEDIANCNRQLEHLTQDADKIQLQLENAYNLVEQGIYTLEVFRTRREKLTDALDEIRQRQQAAEDMLSRLEAGEATQSSLIPHTEALLDSYDDMTNQERNALLKAILHRIEYAKGADGRIEIDLYPRLPKI
ncbi:MAG: hypothetical protein ACI4MG_10010, partial [Aristaeellaceae bacterium]